MGAKGGEIGETLLGTKKGQPLDSHEVACVEGAAVAKEVDFEAGAGGVFHGGSQAVVGHGGE